ncbi:ATP-binding cassette domain-containing protein [Oenococcus alcoholitolerans]|uniref:Multidrug ABC transporter ATPase n=1 Tax=Oenococcus alcoholitolerans TaxID=931074 RepID=A0ABR4XSL6_9LACO|nr:multidrug ABC transporter ATPase [Oenococcus alcoholitolerans]
MMMLKINNLKKDLTGTTIINDLSFSVGLGSIVGLVGRNGAGKTTLFRLISGEYLPEHGKIEIDDNKNVKESIFYLDAPGNFTGGFSAKQLAKIFAVSYPYFDSEWFLSLIGANELPVGKKLSALSKGQKALVLVIAAVTSKAKYILLDEPLDGLDLLIKDKVKQMLISAVSSNQASIIIASHNLSELDLLADRILMIKDGRIYKDYLPGDEISTAKVAKMQMVIEGEIPELVTKEGHILEKRGHLYVVLFKNYDDSMAAKIKDLPVKYIEELQVTSDDIFRATFEEDYRIHSTIKRGKEKEQ